jgi:hypothetical protein
VVVRVQQQTEDMHMGGMAYRLTGTLSADALGEVLERVWSHDRIAMLLAGMMTLFFATTIWHTAKQCESHCHVRVFEGRKAHWCGRSDSGEDEQGSAILPCTDRLYRCTLSWLQPEETS